MTNINFKKANDMETMKQNKRKLVNSRISIFVNENALLRPYRIRRPNGSRLNLYRKQDAQK